jgi:hypothetical protein
MDHSPIVPTAKWCRVAEKPDDKCSFFEGVSIHSLEFLFLIFQDKRKKDLIMGNRKKWDKSLSQRLDQLV